jgi:hypothetical protein
VSFSTATGYFANNEKALASEVPTGWNKEKFVNLAPGADGK